MELKQILDESIAKKASDIYLKAGSPPALRIDGELNFHGDKKLSSLETAEIAEKLFNENQSKRFKEGSEIDFSFEYGGDTRFRANIFLQKGNVSLVLRRISNIVPNFEELHLPYVLEKLSAEKRGLILITGTAGSGKTTTLAAIIDYINRKRPAHIVTIEDPIEIVHQDKRSIIEQREIGTDTQSYTTALRHVVRQAPDVILIGEMRDLDTVKTALSAAETGHLVLSTLHTIDALETINRIIDFFPEREDQQIRQILAGSLRGIVSQRLIQKSDGEGRAPAVEIFIATSTIRNYIIERDKTREIPKIMAKSNYDGMQTFDQSLLQLYQKDLITMEEALANATSVNDLRLAIQQAGNFKPAESRT